MNRLIFATLLFAQCLSVLRSEEPQAPPPAIVIEGQGDTAPGSRITRHAEATTLYSIGEPADDEQLYLELINRARANPGAEALRLANTTDPQILQAYQFFGVDLQKFINDMQVYGVTQPLALEPRLTEAARGHTAWMLAHGIQAHDETDPPGSGNVSSTLGTRLKAVAYPFSTAGESIFAFAQNPEQGHAGFEVDWGNGPGGLQNPPGHRNNNHNLAFREVGIGVLNGIGPNSTGPQLVTIDFAARSVDPLVTGVVYYDLNGNQFYDKGEGIGGIAVNVSSSAFHAATAGSGGYAVPSAAGARTVTFSGGGLSPTNIIINVADENVKVDLPLKYSPPAISGPAAPAAGNPNAYSFTPVVGATGYSWQAVQLQAWSGVEGAEGTTTTVSFTTTGGYNPVSTVKRTGTASFHLAHKAPPTNQFFNLTAKLRPKVGAQLTFWKKVGFSSDTETSVAQVSTDGGASWDTVWSQAGNSKATNSLLLETAFTQRTVELGAYVGKSIQVRFGYLLAAGTFFVGDSDLHGLFVDDISFSATDLLVGTAVSPVVAGTGFLFSPAAAGVYLLSVQPKVGNNLLPSGPFLTVSAVNAPANVAPVFTGLVDHPVTELSALAFRLTATDANVPAQPLTFSQITGPAGLAVASNGDVAWTPGEADGPGIYTVTVRVTDGQLSATNSFKVIVNEANLAPVLGAIAPQSLDELATLNLQLTATDGDLPAQALTFSLVGGPTGLVVSPAGLVSWIPGISIGPSTNPVTVRVSDGSLSNDATFNVVVRDTVQIPVVLTVNQLTFEAAGKLRLDFKLVQGLPLGFALERSASLSAQTWQPVAGAALSAGLPGSFTFRFDAGGDVGFYRVKPQ